MSKTTAGDGDGGGVNAFLRCSPRGVQTETEGARDARAIWQQHLVTAQHLTGAYFGYR